MSEEKRVSAKEFMEYLDRGKLSSLKMIHLALPAGGCIFLGVIFVLYFLRLSQPPQVNEGTVQLITILSAVHGVMAMTNITLALVVFPKLMLSSQKLQGCTTPAQLLGAIVSTRILQLALIEGVALFGLVICLLSVLNGLIFQQPLVWLNLISLMILIGFSLSNLPNEEKVRRFFEQQVMQK